MKFITTIITAVLLAITGTETSSGSTGQDEELVAPVFLLGVGVDDEDARCLPSEDRLRRELEGEFLRSRIPLAETWTPDSVRIWIDVFGFDQEGGSGQVIGCVAVVELRLIATLYTRDGEPEPVNVWTSRGLYSGGPNASNFRRRIREAVRDLSVQLGTHLLREYRTQR